MDYIKRFCEKSIEIAKNRDTEFDRGVVFQAEKTLELISELEELNKKYYMLEEK